MTVKCPECGTEQIKPHCPSANCRWFECPQHVFTHAALGKVKSFKKRY